MKLVSMLPGEIVLAFSPLELDFLVVAYHGVLERGDWPRVPEVCEVETQLSQLPFLPGKYDRVVNP